MPSFMGMVALLASLANSNIDQQISSPKVRVLSDAVGPWHLDRGATKCIASRPFGNASRPDSLVLIPQPTNGKLKISVFSSVPLVASRNNEVEVVFADSALIKGSATLGRSAASGQYILTVTVDDRHLDRLTQSSTLSVQTGKNNFYFNTGSMAPLATALNNCISDLLASWGEDKATQSSIVTPALGSAVGFVGDGDYPTDALRAKEQGMVGFRFWVGSDGRASQCIVVESSGSKSIDEATCAIVNNRVRYVPARDAANAPIRSLVYAQLLWSPH